MIVFRYLFKETLKTQTAVLFVLLLIFMSQQFVRIIADAADGDIPGQLVSSLLLLNIPNMALLMLPISLYLAILFSHGRFYADSEMTVLQAVGISPLQILGQTLLLALLTVGIALVNSLWLAPLAKEQEYQVLDEFRAAPGVALLQAGRFLNLEQGRFIAYIQDQNNQADNTTLKTLFLLEELPHAVPRLILAKTGQVVDEPNGALWLQLQQGARYEGLPGVTSLEINRFGEYDIRLPPREVNQANRKVAATPTGQLWRSNTLIDQAEWQWRVSLPLSAFFLTLFVVPLAKVNPRQGRYAKLLPAIALYLAYFLLLSAARSAVTSGRLPLWPGLFSVPLLFVFGLALPLHIGSTRWWRKQLIRRQHA